ncbi:MAG: ABC transporter permease [Acidimicrobiia bacterium]|nr:ABC transporter permease [Acidimicrobiia bacterium]MDH5522001.1 ABC transporter permease [Acidimicrobiia bacterium]
MNRSPNSTTKILSGPPKAADRTLHPDRIKELTLLGLIALAVIVFGLVIDGYFSGRFFNRVSTSVVVVVILAAAQSLVIISRNVDLSVGSIVGVAAYLTADFLQNNSGANPLVAVLIAVAVGAVLGSVNGLLVAYGGVPAIIVTLGTLALFRTLVSLYSGGSNVTADALPDWVIELNASTIVSGGGFDMRTTFAVAIVVILVLQWLLARMRWGRRLYAIGSNPEAAAQAGIPAKRLVLWSFMGSGALAGLAGFMFMVRVGTISATAGSGLELESVAAAVVGGVSILGGSGTVLGAFLGAVLIDTLRLSLVRVPQVSEFWRDAVLGVLVLLSVIADGLLTRRLSRRAAEQRAVHPDTTADTSERPPTTSQEAIRA